MQFTQTWSFMRKRACWIHKYKPSNSFLRSIFHIFVPTSKHIFFHTSSADLFISSILSTNKLALYIMKKKALFSNPWYLAYCISSKYIQTILKKCMTNNTEDKQLTTFCSFSSTQILRYYTNILGYISIYHIHLHIRTYIYFYSFIFLGMRWRLLKIMYEGEESNRFAYGVEAASEFRKLPSFISTATLLAPVPSTWIHWWLAGKLIYTEVLRRIRSRGDI